MPVVLVTGCSSGFGRAAALAFADAGHTVVATMRDPSRADGLGEAGLGRTVGGLQHLEDGHTVLPG